MHHTGIKTSTLTLQERLTTIGIKYWTLVILLASIDILGPLAADAHLPSLPHMTSDLHTSPSWIQFTIILYLFVMAISSLLGGILSDKYGRRNMTLCGLFIFICGGFGCAFSHSIWTLNICRFIQGIGGGISSIITSSVARDVFLANERMKILGILGSIRPIGIGIAPMFGGWIAGFYGWRMVFFMIAMLGVCVMLLSLYLLPETKGKFFVNFNKIAILHSETNILGNIDILMEDQSINTVTRVGTAKGVIVCEDSNTNHSSESSEFEWSPDTIPMHNCNKISDTSPSLVHSNGETNTNTHSKPQMHTRKFLKIACSDSVLMSVSFIIAFRMVGVFIFLNEFPYVSHDTYNYSQSTTGLMIGIGSIFTILGAFAAIVVNRDANASMHRIDETSNLLFKLSPKNTKLSIMRLASIAALVSCLLLVIPPIILHYSAFMNVLQINAHIDHWELINFIYTKDPWYFLVVPFCVLTFSQGLFIPPASVVVLEPYPHMAASISAILQFWRIILPTFVLMVITQCLSFYTNDVASVVIHSMVGLCSFLCFVLMYGCISGHEVRLRMSGWQDRIENQKREQSQSGDSRNTYGTNTNNKGVSVDVSASVPPVMDISAFNLYELNSNARVNGYNMNNTVYDPFGTSLPGYATMQF